jgi:hypothetical protein
MKAQIYYTLDTDDQIHAKRLGEDLNMIAFVFTHYPDLRIVKLRNAEGKKNKDAHNPHGRIFNGNPFTAVELQAWSDWVDEVIAKGEHAIQFQLPAYRQGHEIALSRFRGDADDFLNLVRETQKPL